jgi:hypothetical protein
VDDRSTRALEVSRHNRFGFPEQLKDAVAETLGADAVKPPRPRRPLEALRDGVRRRGHPDFR